MQVWGSITMKKADVTKMLYKKTVIIPASCRDIDETLLSQLSKEKLERMQCFLKLKSSIWFLARQALLIRGDGDESTCNLLKLWGEDYADIWVTEEKDRQVYFCRDTKCDVQNSGIAHVKANYQVSWTDIFYYTHGGWDNWYIKQRTDSVLFMFGWL